MGANPSRPVYPMPTPGMVPVVYDTFPKSRSRRRAYSAAYAYRPPAMYGYPIYPQVTAHYPQPQPQPQFAPVQVSFVTQPQQQPMQPMQTVQPVLAMPQAFVPVTAAQPVAQVPAPAVVPVAATVQPPFAQAPVIPPPIDTPHTHASRTRFTNFYRPADGPMPMPEADPMMPSRAPSAPPFPGPMHHNPLPPPPDDIWARSPYRQVLDRLPRDLPHLVNTGDRQQATLESEPHHHHHHRHHDSHRDGSLFDSLFGSRRDRDRGRSRSGGGLFRSHSVAEADRHGDPGPSSRRDHHHHHHRTPTVTNIVIPPAPIPDGERPPPIKFNHLGELSGFVNHSRHRILHRNKTYPSAVHLLESMKFVDKPDIAERIRLALDADEVYRLSSQYHEHVRPDWGHIFLKALDDVLYLKFKQHPNLRHLLLNTGIADLVYADPNEYWGEGPDGEGENKLGEALVRVRDRLRLEGER